ncbi:putative dissimilatory sulfite reductase A (dsrA) [marine sediment metagenome]|uniref:Putative dissimilatory sulfite reductase A (DsrA) n=1 Tax=marine sediment metagenome TaxID=412755 RepID=X1BZG5_9ZZZZ
MGFDLGGAGPAVRTGMSCVGAARCEQSCIDEGRTMRMLVNNALDDMHRPALPYKFKYKVSGCPNDCMNSVQRADARGPEPYFSQTSQNLRRVSVS